MIKKKDTPPYYENGNGGKYVAKLTQSGTSAPVVAQEWTNTIGGIVWTRIGVGDYKGTLTGAFTLNKTRIEPFNGGLGVYLPLYYNIPGDRFYNISIGAGGGGNSEINITFVDDAGNNVEWSDTTGGIVVDITVYN